MSAISGVEHTLACVHTTEIGFLGCKNLLGTIRSFALKGYPTLRKTAWKNGKCVSPFRIISII